MKNNAAIQKKDVSANKQKSCLHIGYYTNIQTALYSIDQPPR